MHVVLIADQDVPVLQHQGPAGSGIRNATGARVRVIAPYHGAIGGDVENAVVAAIGDQRRSIRKAAGKGGGIQFAASCATVTPLNVLLAVDLDDPVVTLVRDEDVAICQ